MCEIRTSLGATQQLVFAKRLVRGLSSVWGGPILADVVKSQVSRRRLVGLCATRRKIGF